MCYRIFNFWWSRVLEEKRIIVALSKGPSAFVFIVSISIRRSKINEARMPMLVVFLRWKQLIVALIVTILMTITCSFPLDLQGTLVHIVIKQIANGRVYLEEGVTRPTSFSYR